MYQVGTSAGQAWRFNEGEGEASILKTPLYDTYLTQMAVLNDQERRVKKVKDADDFQKRYDALNDAFDASPYSVDAEVRKQVMGYLDATADYKVRTGKNPWNATNTDPEAQELQKQYQGYRNMASGAQRVVQHMDAQRQLWQANPERYKDDENLKALMEGYEGNRLEEYVSGKRPLPTLNSNAPVADIVVGIKNTLDALRVEVNDMAKFEEVKGDIAGALFAGKDGAAYQNSANQIFNELPEDQKAAITQAAQAQGISEAEYIVADLAQKSITGGWSEERAINDAFEGAKVHVEYLPSGEIKTDRAVELGISKLKEDPVSWGLMIQKYGDEDKIREELKKKPWGQTKPGAGGRGGGGGGDTSGVTTYEDWRGLLQSGSSSARGMLNGVNIDVYFGGPNNEVVSGSIVDVEFKGHYDPAQNKWIPQPGDPSQVTNKYIIRVAVKDSDGNTRIEEREVDEATLDRIAIKPVTSYIGSTQGRREVATGGEQTGVADNW